MLSQRPSTARAEAAPASRSASECLPCWAPNSTTDRPRGSAQRRMKATCLPKKSSRVSVFACIDIQYHSNPRVDVELHRPGLLRLRPLQVRGVMIHDVQERPLPAVGGALHQVFRGE